jgi:hypothetical protein
MKHVSGSKMLINSQAIGPVCTMFEYAVDGDGYLTYELPGRTQENIRVGNRLAGRTVLIFSQSGQVAVLDPDEPEGKFLAMGFFVKNDVHVVVPTEDGVFLLNQDGQAKRLPDPLPYLRQHYLRCLTEQKPEQIGFRILLNTANMRFFHPDLQQQLLEPRELNRLELFFNIETGMFTRAKLMVQEKDSQQLIREAFIKVMPIRWPSLIKAEKARKAREKQGKAAQTTGATTTNGTASREGLAGIASNGSGSQERARPRTTHLPIDYLLDTIEMLEVDPQLQWEEIENNLELLDTHRTYRLVGHFPSIIARNTKSWPLYKLREVFGNVPGAGLQLLFEEYMLETCLALSDEHPNESELMEWLEDHEVDRLLSLNLAKVPETAEGARLLLRVGKQAGQKDVRRVWRMLLRWMNADFGRREERAIHQKKDNIAKRLQKARDLLEK